MEELYNHKRLISLYSKIVYQFIKLNFRLHNSIIQTFAPSTEYLLVNAAILARSAHFLPLSVAISPVFQGPHKSSKLFNARLAKFYNNFLLYADLFSVPLSLSLSLAPYIMLLHQLAYIDPVYMLSVLVCVCVCVVSFVRLSLVGLGGVVG